jgi:hypothetical protein
MKLRHAPHARHALLAVVLLVALAALMVCGCAHPQKRNDWRNPAPPMACTSDADCRGGTCAMELGASQGTCSPAGGSSGAPADGGAPSPGLNPGPGPNVQPSPSDIQL